MQEENQKTNKYWADIKNLPLWLQYTLAIFAIIGTLGTLYGT